MAQATAWSANAPSLVYHTASPVFPVVAPVRLFPLKPMMIPPAAATAFVSNAIGISPAGLLAVPCQ
jgi:hypothetical protein